MNTFESAVLGLVQGLTEFLPISSTAHLRIAPAVLGWKDAGAAFTAVLQLGTLAAVVGYFVRELVGMVRAAVSPARWKDPEAQRLLQLIVGTIPIGIAGLLLRHAIEGAFRSLWVIATSLIVVGLLMAVIERTARGVRTMDQIQLRDAVLVGMAQMLALVPGVSRSGITLIAGMAIGLRRDTAARFSFLLSVPAVAAAGLFELPKVMRAHDISRGPLLVGLAVAAASGYASIAWLLRFLRTRTTMPFVIYRVALGAALLMALGAGVLTP